MSKSSGYFILDNISGNHDKKELKRELDVIHGVSCVSINDAKNKVAVDFDNQDLTPTKIANKIEKLGYEIIDIMLD